MLLSGPKAIPTCFKNTTELKGDESYDQQQDATAATAAAAAAPRETPREVLFELNKFTEAAAVAVTPHADKVEATAATDITHVSHGFVGKQEGEEEAEVVMKKPPVSRSPTTTMVPLVALLTPPPPESTSLVHEETPSTKVSKAQATPVAAATPTPKLKSSLKKSSHSGSRRTSSIQRRVRGLWNEGSDSLFVQLHDDLMARVFQFLDLTDVVRLSAVSQRFHHVAHSKRVWEAVDATDAVAKMYAYYYSDSNQEKAADQTSVTLTRLLEQHSSAIRSLAINQIENRLVSTQFLPCLPALQTLVLGHFDDLSDTAVHVWLLGTSSAANSGAVLKKNHNHHHKLHHARPSTLRSLMLMDCPKLTNAVVRSIAHTCPALNTLSLAGCLQISSLAPLEHRMLQEEVDEQEEPQQPELDDATGNNNNEQQQQQQQQPAAASTSLAGLFAPPGTSPHRIVRRSNSSLNKGVRANVAVPPLRVHHHRRRSSSSSVNNEEAPLFHVDVSRTAVPPMVSRSGPSTNSSSERMGSSLFLPPPPESATTTTANTGSLSSLFAPPPASTKTTTPSAAPATTAGGSSLQCLFTAPPPTSKTTKTTSDKNSHGSLLTSMFAPPVAAATATTMALRPKTVPPKTTVASADRAPTASNKGSSLTSLFAPPPVSATAAAVTKASRQARTVSGGGSLTALFAPPTSAAPAAKTSTTIAARPVVVRGDKTDTTTTGSSLASLFTPPLGRS